MMDQKNQLMDRVVKGGYCIGCGACAAVDGSSMTVQIDAYGRYQAAPKQCSFGDEKSLKVCPFSAEAPNEDVLGKRYYGVYAQSHESIGYYLKNYAGHVLEGNFRAAGSSGGMGTWIVHELLDKGLVDAVIHVKERTSGDTQSPMFGFDISASKEDVLRGAKSRYYPVEMSGVLKFVQNNPGRYVFVGIPCFVKAVRLLAEVDPIIKERIKFCVGIICGHLKSSRFAEMFAWQCDVAPSELRAIDFRKKIAGQGAHLYGVEITGEKDGKTVGVTRTNREFFGHNWGHGFFKYEACDYCDDVLAETADIAVGDAWLPQYVNDDKGTNVVVVRHPVIVRLIEQAQSQGRLQLDEIPADEIARSQDAGLRHRREGLAYRLYLKDQKEHWRPVKCVKANKNHLDPRSRGIQDLRIAMAAQSHEAFFNAREQNDFTVFKAAMEPLVERYQRFYRDPLTVRIKRRIKNILKRFV